MFRRTRNASDFSAEIEAHIELEAARLQEQGLSYEDARTAARRAFGNVTHAQEHFYESGRWLAPEHLWQDVRYGLRMLRKSPGFTAIAVLTIALGIGATTAIFSVVDATLFHPLPYAQPDQLVRIEDDLPGVGAQDVGMSVPEWHDLQSSGIFDNVSPIGGGDVNLTGASQPERIPFLNVTPNYFAVLGVKPQLGSAFNPEDHTPGFTLEVLISDGLWKRAFAADPGILGKSLRLDNDLYRVIGVMPADFHDPGRTAVERSTDIWAASGFAAAPAPPPLRNARFLQTAIARIKPGVTIDVAQSQLNALVAAMQKQFPVDYPLQNAWSVRLVPLKESVVGNVRQSLILLLGAVGLVLLIGCVNVANLLLARASARGREVAVRQALGAPRQRLVRQLLTDSLLLSLLGGTAGLAILYRTNGFLLRMVPESLPRLTDISIHWRILLFALVASVAAGVIFGMAPALETGRLDLTRALRLGGRGLKGSMEQTRTRRALVVTEFALALVLMIAAGLLFESFWDLFQVRLGFNPRHVMAVQTWLPVPNDPKTDIYGTPALEAPFLRELLRRCRSLPGVELVALGSSASIPLDHDRDQYPLIVEGRDNRSKEAPLVERKAVTPDYFHLLGIPQHSGRVFSELDNATSPPVAVINEAMARTYWPNQDPVGKRFNLKGNNPWITVIGVIADTRTESLAEGTVPQIYLSLYQTRTNDLAIFLRGQLNSA